KKHLINPVEAREAALTLPETLEIKYPEPPEEEIISGFRDLTDAGLSDFIKARGLAMDDADIKFCQSYFKDEGRDPTVTEIKMIDTYWSDHCRHTTFLTEIDNVTFDDPLTEKTYKEYLETRKALGREKKPVCLMDIATIAAKSLKAQGLLDKLDESEEINACTVKTTVTVNGEAQPWLLLFKNETHNHPTEIEPFGGAATCIGGAIRDPLSGRAYVYGAMRVTGAADPTVPVSDTIPGKLPQRKLVTTAAAGYSSYGNQIGLATGIVDELYHPGYAAKRMEIGAVIAAAPSANVRREKPEPGDAVILLGGGTGRDGIGGATGSSKAHNVKSVETCGAEVQKGNAPEERKLQRLFRNGEACRMIRRCNDFGAGGVSVAIGELADGLLITLDRVPKKYEGLSGTELAISESQERMAVVVAEKDKDAFIKLAQSENLSATPVAVVTEDPRLKMTFRGKTIVVISREVLNSNGAPKHIKIQAAKPNVMEQTFTGAFKENALKTVADLNVCSKRGLSERFDSTIGAGSVLMPFGGKRQRTPVQAMVQKVSVEKGDTKDCSLMAWGFDPYLSSESPYHGAYCAVVDSVSKLIASGADFKDVYLTFQEYFEKPGRDGARWGKPLSALLGAYAAQTGLKIAAIGGKDSMSGSFEDLDVPPTLVSFAVTTDKTDNIRSPEFKREGNKVVLIEAEKDENGLPKAESLVKTFNKVTELLRSGKAVSCYAAGSHGVFEAVFKCCLGSGFGFSFENITLSDLFKRRCGAFILETAEDTGLPVIGEITAKDFCFNGEKVPFDALEKAYEEKLESVYPVKAAGAYMPPCEVKKDMPGASAPAVKCARPRVLIPVFPGTNCEYDSAKAVEAAGLDADIFIVKNLSGEDVARSAAAFSEKLKRSQMLFIPGGFSGGDEPDGSGKFITAFLRGESVKSAVTELLDARGGLICGVCNGFQALIKLGLLPYGRITDASEHSPTLTFNNIARHQSKIVRVRVESTMSPFLRLASPGDIISAPVSHGEGRFVCEDALLKKLCEGGQIATRYVDDKGEPSGDVEFNPNGSVFAVEGITSPDGRVFGKMGHAERVGASLYKNVPGNYDLKMFEAAARYFK
ncbi:MAG: phosphoribosylformylglycinamidine synthase, partial [Clostridia bacterium]|nr:phosphoribosylformylglycinamidine synthase [Clostridia bacterium]